VVEPDAVWHESQSLDGQSKHVDLPGNLSAKVRKIAVIPENWALFLRV